MSKLCVGDIVRLEEPQFAEHTGVPLIRLPTGTIIVIVREMPGFQDVYEVLAPEGKVRLGICGVHANRSEMTFLE